MDNTTVSHKLLELLTRMDSRLAVIEANGAMAITRMEGDCDDCDACDESEEEVDKDDSPRVSHTTDSTVPAGTMDVPNEDILTIHQDSIASEVAWLMHQDQMSHEQGSKTSNKSLQSDTLVVGNQATSRAGLRKGIYSLIKPAWTYEVNSPWPSVSKYEPQMVNERNQIALGSLGEIVDVPSDNRLDFGFQRFELESLPPNHREDIIKALHSWTSGGAYDRDPRARPHSIYVQDINETESVEYKFPGMVKIQQGQDLNGTTCSRSRGSLDGCVGAIASWRRLIIFQGAAAIDALHEGEPCSVARGILNNYLEWIVGSSASRMSFEKNAMLNWITRAHYTASMIEGDFETWKDTMVSSVYNGHSPQIILKFHVAYYAAVEDCDLVLAQTGRIVPGSWPSGVLYDDGPQIRKEAVSIVAVGDKLDSLCPANRKLPMFYTLLALLPETIYPVYLGSSWYAAQGPTYDILSATLVVICKILYYVNRRWTELVDDLRRLLDKETLFMDPRAHDKLLVDDEAFSRSRRYFWILSCLKQYKSALEDSIAHWENCHKTWKAEAEKLNGLTSIHLEQFVKVNEEWTKMKACKVRIDHHITDVTVLRDGLFNASAVMESRAATRLGENVKLLTFISIFFLPLSFCTSLWSVSNTLFPIHTFIYVIVFVALLTYIVVFNLNTIVRLWVDIYKAYRDFLIEKMKVEDEPWCNVADRFENSHFRPRADMVKPTEWLLLGYAVRTGVLESWAFVKRMCCKWFWRRWITSSDDDETSTAPNATSV